MEVCFQLSASRLTAQVGGSDEEWGYTGTSFPILWRRLCDCSVVVCRPAPSQGGCSLMSLNLGTSVDFTSKKPGGEVPSGTAAAQEGWGKGGRSLWVAGNLSVIFFFSISSNRKSFEACKPFTEEQFLINKPNHLSSPKEFSAKEFPACRSFIERALKCPRSVWALTRQVCAQPVLRNRRTRRKTLLLPSGANRLISRGRSAPNNLLCQMDASVLIYVLKITGHGYAQHRGLDAAFVAFGGENVVVGFSDPST